MKKHILILGKEDERNKKVLDLIEGKVVEPINGKDFWQSSPRYEFVFNGVTLETEIIIIYDLPAKLIEKILPTVMSDTLYVSCLGKPSYSRTTREFIITSTVD